MKKKPRRVAKPRVPKVWRDVEAALGASLFGLPGLVSFCVGAKDGDRLFVDIKLTSKERAAVWRWWQANSRWLDMQEQWCVQGRWRVRERSL